MRRPVCATAVAAIAVTLAMTLATGCATASPMRAAPEIPAPVPHVDPGFAAYSAANRDAKLVRLTEHVYAAVGYDIGNIASAGSMGRAGAPGPAAE